ncbi:DUF2231 domain-containing protein [Hyphomonas jannaschiana]|uniref:DUF2231 domain-containing protein n=1 Tax=Hyphomonas jannaschiana TaxID=86 RepID=UPI0005512E9F|nr:DUF2231 domain-containing protein [Hyphomonas jannaschiana]
MSHPLHPAIVHFPIACWTLAAGSDIAGLWFGKIPTGWSGGLLAIGCVMAVFAMLAGMVELRRVPDGAPMKDAWVHMAAMLAAFTLFSLSLLVRLEQMKLHGPNSVSLVLDAGGVIALVIGGLFGGRLVYVHGVGRTPPK